MPIRTDNDNQLLTLLAQGDEEAFTVIFERYNKMLYALAFRYLKSETMAEDAVQHIFLRLWEGRQFLVVTVNLRNYLYTMVKNHILNEIRNNNTAVEKNYEMAQLSSAEADDVMEKLEKKEMMQKLREAIERLPEQKRKVCLLKLQGDLSNQEIADKLNLSVPTVKTHYAQAVKILRGYFSNALLIILLYGIDKY